IHPGFLPDIRGADGLLWSVLLAGRPAAAAFHLAPGIDTGNILLSRWLPKLPPVMCGLTDAKMRYRAAYAFIDPWVRAFALASLLRDHPSLESAPATPQAKEAGVTYHFMHPALKARALQALLGNQSSGGTRIRPSSRMPFS